MILTQRYLRALGYAFGLHSTQARKGSSVPYMAHLLGVSSLALEYGADEDGAIAGLLHDAVEDQGGSNTLREIDALFGATVSEIVAACTDSFEVPRPAWRERKRTYLERVATASPTAQLVSACDKLYNVRTIISDYRVVGEQLWERFSGGCDGTLWYYKSLTAVYPPSNPAVGELQRTVSELESLTRTAPSSAGSPSPVPPRC